MNLFTCTTVLGLIASILATHRNAVGVAVADTKLELEFQSEENAFIVRMNPERHLVIFCRPSPYIQETLYTAEEVSLSRYIVSRKEIQDHDALFDELLKCLMSARWTTATP